LRGFSGFSKKLGAIVLVIAATTLAACGGDSETDAAPSISGRYVTAANINHFKPGTPARATLDWWRAVQFGNPGVARHFYAPGTAPDEAQLRREILATSSQFVGVPQINSADVHGGAGTLYFFLSRPGATVVPRPLSINLVKVEGEWRLADNLLLEQQVARVAKLLRAGEASGD
jgi:hypothetical protein